MWRRCDLFWLQAGWDFKLSPVIGALFCSNIFFFFFYILVAFNFALIFKLALMHKFWKIEILLAFLLSSRRQFSGTSPLGSILYLWGTFFLSFFSSSAVFSYFWISLSTYIALCAKPSSFSSFTRGTAPLRGGNGAKLLTIELGMKPSGAIGQLIFGRVGSFISGSLVGGRGGCVSFTVFVGVFFLPQDPRCDRCPFVWVLWAHWTILTAFLEHLLTSDFLFMSGNFGGREVFFSLAIVIVSHERQALEEQQVNIPEL